MLVLETVKTGRDGSKLNQFEKGLQSSYLAQLSAFLEAAESSSAQWPPLNEAVSVCEIIDYARESSQLGTSLSYSRDG